MSYVVFMYHRNLAKGFNSRTVAGLYIYTRKHILTQQMVVVETEKGL
jgi:hypothetical protein